MKKTLIFLSILLTIGILFVLGGTTRPILRSSTQPIHDVREISFSLQATAEPPIVVIPTIVINPTPGSNSAGFMGQITPLTILLFVLVAGIILIALIAVLRKPS